MCSSDACPVRLHVCLNINVDCMKKKQHIKFRGMPCHFYGGPMELVSLTICEKCPRTETEAGKVLPRCPRLLGGSTTPLV